MSRRNCPCISPSAIHHSAGEGDTYAGFLLCKVVPPPPLPPCILSVWCASVTKGVGEGQAWRLSVFSSSSPSRPSQKERDEGEAAEKSGRLPPPSPPRRPSQHHAYIAVRCTPGPLGYTATICSVQEKKREEEEEEKEKDERPSPSRWHGKEGWEGGRPSSCVFSVVTIRKGAAGASFSGRCGGGGGGGVQTSPLSHTTRHSTTW